MFRTSVRIVLALVVLLGIATAPASAVDLQKAPAVSAPLPFLDGCPVAMSRLQPKPVVAATDPTLSPAPAVCTGCSGHNCFFQTVGTTCLVDGRRGRCTVHDNCPELRETSCFCVAP